MARSKLKSRWCKVRSSQYESVGRVGLPRCRVKGMHNLVAKAYCEAGEGKDGRFRKEFACVKQEGKTLSCVNLNGTGDLPREKQVV